MCTKCTTINLCKLDIYSMPLYHYNTKYRISEKSFDFPTLQVNKHDALYRISDSESTLIIQRDSHFTLIITYSVFFISLYHQIQFLTNRNQTR